MTGLAAAVEAHALEHYEDGWDVVVECWDTAEIEEVLARTKATTLEEAVASFRDLVEVWNDRRADARVCAGEG